MEGCCIGYLLSDTLCAPVDAVVGIVIGVAGGEENIPGLVSVGVSVVMGDTGQFGEVGGVSPKTVNTDEEVDGHTYYVVSCGSPP